MCSSRSSRSCCAPRSRCSSTCSTDDPGDQRKAEQEQRLLDANLRANAERLRSSRSCASPSSARRRSSQSLPIVLYLEADGPAPRVPQFVGGNFTAVTGFSFDAVEAQPTLWADRLHPEDRERALAAISDRQRTGAMAIEYRWQCADGQYKHFLDQAVLLRSGEGDAAEYAGTLLDVTDRKELENQLLQARKMDAIGKLTGGIAHDFNNLLAAVLGGLGLIERRLPLEEEHQKIIGMTRRAAEQGSELVGACSPSPAARRSSPTRSTSAGCRRRSPTCSPTRSAGWSGSNGARTRRSGAPMPTAPSSSWP
jgi:PAS domain S-box-containing protein